MHDKKVFILAVSQICNGKTVTWLKDMIKYLVGEVSGLQETQTEHIRESLLKSNLIKKKMFEMHKLIGATHVN